MNLKKGYLEQLKRLGLFYSGGNILINWFRMTRIFNNPIFLMVLVIFVFCLISSLGSTSNQETYNGKLGRCVDMCKESNRFGRLIKPNPVSPKYTIVDYKCECY